MEPRTCIDCGRPTAGGLRCRTCHGRELARRALSATADDDQALLAMVSDEGLTGNRLAVRLGVSRVRAYGKIRLARRRERARQEEGTRP